MATLTVSGNEITDAVRLANTQGDGRAQPDSSFGIWEATTNLFKNGGLEAGTSGWSAAGSAVTLSRILTDFKFGAACLQMAFTGADAEARMQDGVQKIGEGSVVIAPNTVYTVSGWLKAISGTPTMFIRVDEYTSGNVSTQSESSNTFVTTAGWVRYTFTFTTSATTARILITFMSNTGVNGNKVLIDGVQLEQKGFATPYVETNGATAARAAARVQAPSSLLNSAQAGVAFRIRANLAAPASNTVNYFLKQWRNQGGNQDGYQLRYRGNSDAQGGWRLDQTLAGVTVPARFTPVVAYATGDLITVVAYWKAGTLGISINGANFITAAITGSPDMSAVSLFDIATDQLFGAGQSDFDILWAVFFGGTVTNADAATLNALGNNNPTLNTLGPAAKINGVWSADTSNFNRLSRVQITVPITITTTRGPRLIIKNKIVLPLLENIGLVKRIFFNPNKFIVNIQLQPPTHTKKIIKTARTVPLNMNVSSHKKRFYSAVVTLTLAVGSQSLKRYHGLKRAIRTIPGLDRVNRDA